MIARRPSATPLVTFTLLVAWLTITPDALFAVEPVPDKLVVLTFDDSAKSHFTVVRPILKQYGFGATFFITEGFDFRDNKRDYMTWDEIAQLHRDGFEIGNHTRDHLPATANNLANYEMQLAAIRDACLAREIPAPVSFAYPGNAIDKQALSLLAKNGINFARRGGEPERPYKTGRGVAFEPGLDHPLLLPSAGDARPHWTIEDFQAAVHQARHGRIAVLQFHGVPDTAHDWVSTSRELFQSMMNYLAVNEYRVIAMRDLAKYVDPSVAPTDPWGPIEDRKQRLAADLSLDNFRQPRDDDDARYWLANMSLHGFTIPEMSAATGLDADAVRERLRKWDITSESAARLVDPRRDSAPLPSVVRVLPYPGGRHPRAAFRDGAIRPQRETKISVFAPWKDVASNDAAPANAPKGPDAQGTDANQTAGSSTPSYVVVDVPEAIWVQENKQPRELLYLAHTHVPTMWDRRKEHLPPLEWTRLPDGRLQSERPLPNGVRFGATVTPQATGVEMELWLTNGSHETLTGLLVQNCVMLAHARGFAARANENKLIRSPFVACRNDKGDRWIITAWSRCQRPWANPPCPCIHSDPQFADCPPGETRRLRGWLTFYEGADIQAELDRLARLWNP